MKLKQIISILLVLVLAVSLAACTPTTTPPADDGKTDEGKTDEGKTDEGTPDEGTPEREPVTLKWLTGNVGANPADGPEVWAAANELLNESLPGTSLDITCVPFSEYDQKWQLEAASGAAWDLAWFGWMLNLQNEVNNGSLMPLNDLVDTYGSNLRNELAQFMFDCNTINGNLYLIPNNQIAAIPAPGFRTTTELADKYLDIPAFEAAAKEWTDSDKLWPTDSLLDVIEDFAQKCKDGGDLQLGISAGYMTGYFGPRNNWYTTNIGGSIPGATMQSPVMCRAHDETGKVVGYTDYAEEELAYFKRMKEWYDKGFIRKDAMTIEEWKWEPEDYKQGKSYIFTIHNYDKYTQDMETARWEMPITVLPALESHAPTGSNPTATSECIMSGSKNPERAMEFLNFFHTAAGVDVYNMLVYGLEGKHWEFTDKAAGTIETFGYTGQVTSDQPYGIPKWTIGNTYHVYAPQGTDPAYDKYMCGEFNTSARSVPLSGFVFNTENLTAEVAAWGDIQAEFIKGLQMGTYADVEKAFNERNARLDAAGCQNFAIEMQKQVDEFLASK